MTCPKQKQIERRREDFNYGWEPHSGEWKEGYVYRIKPKAKVKKWRWVFKDQHADCGKLYITGGHHTAEGASQLGMVEFIQKIDSTMIEVYE